MVMGICDAVMNICDAASAASRNGGEYLQRLYGGGFAG
jgi:hypothetical protein